MAKNWIFRTRKDGQSELPPSFGNLAVGGWGGGADTYMKGTINYFRYYDRVLSDVELAQNREVDEARYFGRLAVTNVVVSIDGVETACKVEGEYTFDAPETVVEGGETKRVAGCFVEELVDGKWSGKRWLDGATGYAYDAETSGGKVVRVTWRGPRPGMVLVIR